MSADTVDRPAPRAPEGQVPPAGRRRFAAPLARLAENPVILKELRGRMRGRRAFVLLSVYLSVISLLVGFVYILIASESSYGYWDPEIRQTAGKAIFFTVVLLQLVLVTLIGPSLTTGAISSERERQTFDLLRTTLLSARDLVLGKLGVPVVYLCLLVLAALPIESLAFLLGGVGLGELLVSNLLLAVTALFFCTLGIFASSLLKRTTTATVVTYASMLSSLLLLVVIYFTVEVLVDPLYPLDLLFEGLGETVLWMIVSTNPILTAIFSEVILVDDQSFFVTTSIFGSDHPMLSPWILFTVIYLGLTALMVRISIRAIERPDR